MSDSLPEKKDTCASCVWWPDNFHMHNPHMEKPEKCWHPQINRATAADDTCRHHEPSSATDFNVPSHCTRNAKLVDLDKSVSGACEILIVTHFKDFIWLEYCLKSIQRHLTGFQGVTVAHPEHESKLFSELPERFGVRLHPYREEPGKGMIQHMVKMAEADKIVPSGTKYVLHCDADCVFRMPTTPADYFKGGKPYYLIRTWDSLTTEDPHNPNSRVVSDCLQWKPPTDRQLGFDTKWYTMCMNTAVLPIEFYQPYRDHIASVHGVTYEYYMMSGRNEFPQTVMDWTAMGAFAHHFMPERFTWIDVEKGDYPVDRKKAFWSHGGITPTIRIEIENYIAPAPSFPVRVWVLANCYNEAEIIPFWLRHYAAFAERIIVWDDCSTDGSRELLMAHPKVTLLDWPYEEGIENNEWLRFAYAVYPMAKGCADFLIWCDFDEFIYHPDMPSVFREAIQERVEVMPTIGFNMIGEFPKDDGRQIWEMLKTGVPSVDYSKPIVFRPEAQVRWVRGKHLLEECNPVMGRPALKLLHYRYLNPEFTKRKNDTAYRRVRDKASVRTSAPDYKGKHSPEWSAQMQSVAVDVVSEFPPG